MSTRKKYDAQYYLERGVAPQSNMGLRVRLSILFSRCVLALHTLSPFLARIFTQIIYLGKHDRTYMRLYWIFQTRNSKLARQYRNYALLNGAEDAEAMKSFALEAYRSGSLTSPAFEEDKLLKTPRFEKLLRNIQSSLELLEEGFSYPAVCEKSFIPLPARSFYFLHNSLPINSGGYATRSHGILTHLNKQGFTASGITRLGFPHDRGREYADKVYAEKDSVNDVDYYRLISQDVGLGRLPMKDYLAENIEAHRPVIEAEHPVILHGASNFVNGLTVNALARMYGLISIYETRGLWEITRMSREPEYEGTDAYNLYVRMETQASLEADHCFTITEALKKEMVKRGIPADKITVVPNGVDTKRFQPLPCDQAFKQELGFDQSDIIIGYIGSVVDYEGLDYLIKAMKKLEQRGFENAKLLIVGDGAVLDDLKDLVRRLKLDNCVKFTGRVPHEVVESYYSLIDITPFPRKGLPVCEMVSPLKPFEAMAMRKTILISDVAAMQEFVEHLVTGIIVEKDNIDSLTDGLATLLESPELRDKLSKNALYFVRRERDWNVIVKDIAGIYRNLVKRHKHLN